MIALARKPFYIMRHAETYDNKRGVISGGDRDPILTPDGHIAAREQNKVFSALEVKPKEVIFTGKARTLQTLYEAVGMDLQNMTVIPDRELNERYLGELDGKISHRELLRMKREGELQPGAESEEAHAKRVIPAINAHLERNDTPPLVVTHSGTIRRVFDAMGFGKEINVPNTQIYECVPEGETGWKVYALSVQEGKLQKHDITARPISRLTQGAMQFIGGLSSKGLGL